jgi:hypothetical protein
MKKSFPLGEITISDSRKSHKLLLHISHEEKTVCNHNGCHEEGDENRGKTRLKEDYCVMNAVCACSYVCAL